MKNTFVPPTVFWVALGALSLASCAGPLTENAPLTNDSRYVTGTLLSYEASLATGENADDPAALLTSDTQSVPAGRSLLATSLVDNGNGTVTVTKTGKHWGGFEFTKQLTRQKMAQLAEIPNIGNSITKTGTELWFPGSSVTGTPFATIEVTMTWANVAGTVELTELTRSGERLGLGANSPQVLKVDATYAAGVLVSKTVGHYSGEVAPANLLFTARFEQFAASGTTAAYTKISRFDNAVTPVLKSYRILTETGSSQTVERYNAVDLLRETTIRTETASGWSLTRTSYRVDGSAKHQTEETVTIVQDGNAIHVERLISLDGVSKTVSMSVVPTTDGYTMTVTNSNGGGESWSAVQADDGTWTINDGSGPVVIDSTDAV
jgi:hypothetical protein